jgi:hypothetical protein
VTNEELSTYAIQLMHDKDTFGLFMLADHLINEREQRQLTRRKASGKRPTDGVVICMAIPELVDCGMDWDLMRKLVIQEKRFNRKTVVRHLDKNRAFIERVACMPDETDGNS